MHFLLNVTFAALNFQFVPQVVLNWIPVIARVKSGGVGNEDELLLISSSH